MFARSAAIVTGALLGAGALVAPAYAANAASQNYIGIQGFALSGVHHDIIGDQHGLGAGAFVEARIGGSRWSFHFEGVPVVSVPQRASAYYGLATPAVGIVDAAIRYSLDANGRFTIGVGDVAINQRTPLPNISQVVASRLAGVWTELLARVPARGRHFYEADLAVAPHLTGSDHFAYSDGSPAVEKDERASTVSASLGLGFRARSSEVIVGLRAINFNAQFTKTLAAADINAGVGIFIEWRYLHARAAAAATPHP